MTVRTLNHLDEKKLGTSTTYSLGLPLFIHHLLAFHIHRELIQTDLNVPSWAGNDGTVSVRKQSCHRGEYRRPGRKHTLL